MKRSIGLLIIAGVAALASAPLVSERPRLVWNATPSVPTGLYVIARDSPRRGDLALIDPPPAVRTLASARGYLARRSRLIKPVVAVAGQRVCRLHALVWVRGHRPVFARTADALGRSLPSWRGCRVLRHEEVFVLGQAADSFDSRYFGPIDSRFVVGIAHPIWAELRD